MTLGRELVGTEQPAVTAEVERGQLRAFALATGETDPVYVDIRTAVAAGHADLPAPPTFVFGLALGRGEQDFAWLADLGVDLRHVLHGEQSFVLHDVAHAGDTIVLQPRIVDVFSKQGGALQFLVRETIALRADGSPVADLRETLIVRETAA